MTKGRLQDRGRDNGGYKGNSNQSIQNMPLPEPPMDYEEDKTTQQASVPHGGTSKPPGKKNDSKTGKENEKGKPVEPMEMEDPKDKKKKKKVGADDDGEEEEKDEKKGCCASMLDIVFRAIAFGILLLEVLVKWKVYLDLRDFQKNETLSQENATVINGTVCILNREGECHPIGTGCGEDFTYAWLSFTSVGSFLAVVQLVNMCLETLKDCCCGGCFSLHVNYETFIFLVLKELPQAIMVLYFLMACSCRFDSTNDTAHWHPTSLTFWMYMVASFTLARVLCREMLSYDYLKKLFKSIFEWCTGCGLLCKCKCFCCACEYGDFSCTCCGSKKKTCADRMGSCNGLLHTLMWACFIMLTVLMILFGTDVIKMDKCSAT